jgi:hypothetical protein
MKGRWHNYKAPVWTNEVSILSEAGANELQPWAPLCEILAAYNDAVEDDRKGIRRSAERTKGVRIKVVLMKKMKNAADERMRSIAAELETLLEGTGMSADSATAIVKKAVAKDCTEHGVLVQRPVP